MMCTLQFDEDMSSEFGVKSDIKQGCVHATTLFGIFFALLLKHDFKSSTDGIYPTPDPMVVSSTSQDFVIG